jgi:hypothetical protein
VAVDGIRDGTYKNCAAAARQLDLRDHYMTIWHHSESRQGLIQCVTRCDKNFHFSWFSRSPPRRRPCIAVLSLKILRTGLGNLDNVEIILTEAGVEGMLLPRTRHDMKFSFTSGAKTVMTNA